MFPAGAVVHKLGLFLKIWIKTAQKKSSNHENARVEKFLQDRGITVSSYLKPGLVALLVLSKK